MSPPGVEVPRKRGRGADPERTRAALVEAARASLVEEGFGGTTARSISTRAGCNQAAIYYHFSGIEPLLLRALDESSQRRLAHYRDRLVDVGDLPELVGTLESLHADDRASGHLTLLTELIGGITARPELRAGIEDAIAPWLEFVEARIREAVASLAFGPTLPVVDLADAIFSLVIGVELRNKIDGRSERADRLFRLAGLVATLVQEAAAPDSTGHGSAD